MTLYFHLREKHKEWYCCVTLKSEKGKRKERWIPLRILVKEDRKKEAKKLVDALMIPGAFNPDSVEATNETLRSLGLFTFDNDWHIIRDGNFRAEISPDKIVALSKFDALTQSQILEAQLGLKKGKKMLFGNYLALWYNVHKEEIALNTAAALHSHVFTIIGPWFNDHHVTLTGIQPEDIEAFYRDRARYVTSNTLRHYHGTIRNALQYAFKRGYVVNNIADRVTKPKKVIYKASFYNEAQLKQLFGYAKGTNLEFAIHMAATYGLRREEICGLKWDAIDFQYKSIAIRHTVSETCVNGKFQMYLKDTTKNKSSFRTLPVSDYTLNMLMAMKQKQEKMKTLFGNRYNHDFDGYVYVYENGDIVRPNWVTYAFKQFLSDNKMPPIRFHDLRHSCATLLRHQGVKMEEISKWLGHSNTQTTEQVYAHYDESGKADTLKTIVDALNGDDKKEMS